MSVQPYHVLVHGLVPLMLPGLPIKLRLLICPLFDYRFGSYLEGAWAEGTTLPSSGPAT